MRYVQCELQKGNKIDTSWIEERFAVIGKFVRMKKLDTDEWDEGWVVMKTYGSVSEEQAKHMRDLYKHHRKATDI